MNTLRSLVAAAIPLIALSSLLAQVTITNSFNTGATLVGVGSASGVLTVASNSTNYDLNPSTLALIGSYANSGSVVDIGKTADGLKTIELQSNGTFSVFSDATRSVISSGNFTGYANSVWGISDSYVAGANEYMYVVFQPVSSSTAAIGRYNLTTATFSGAIVGNNVSSNPSGIAAYLESDGSASVPDHYRYLFTLSGAAPVTMLDQSPYGGNQGTYLTGASGSDATDASIMGGQFFAVSSNGFVESGAFTARNQLGLYSSVPEPTTYAALFGLTALGLAAYRKRKQSV